MAKAIRDNGYYLKRLEAEHSAVQADFLAGKYATANDVADGSGHVQAPHPFA